jgi:GntR family transcriptional regulator
VERSATDRSEFNLAVGCAPSHPTNPANSKGPITVLIQIVPGDGVPIYAQIVNGVKFLVASGRLAPGEELPPIRSLAEELLVNPNTVARAYRELEVAGVVTKRRTAGTFVSETAARLTVDQRRDLLAPRVDALLTEAQGLGVGLDDLIELVRRRGESKGG